MSGKSAEPAAATFDNPFLPAPRLAKGGLAAHGLGERCTVSTRTGALSISVPIAATPGRGASSAELTLAYHSGSGRSPFGLGWDVPVPAVSRRTATRLPTYTDADTFVVSGVDDLVPQLEPDGTGGWQPVESSEVIGSATYRVRRYRPRDGDTRMRVEQCSSGGDVFWRTVDGSNVTRIFGRSDSTRIVDPSDPGGPIGRRIFRWLLEEVRDDCGNVARYEYKAEDVAGVARQPGEQHRLRPDAPVRANRYLKRIHYANAVPDDPTSTRLMIVFDYGEHDLDSHETRPWLARSDAYSDYTSGFEVRTWRLCRRIMIFHDFGADLGPGPSPRLARTIELTHDPQSSRLSAVRQVGYRWQGSDYGSAALPPLEFDYVDARTSDRIREATVRAVPDGSHVQLVDLENDGLPGVLTTGPGGWWYQRPAGDATFDAPAPVRELPSVGLANGAAALRDVDGSGRVACTGDDAALSGSSVRRADGSWDAFRPYSTRAVTDGTLERLDLDGDGLADLVRTGPDEWRWSASRGREGYGPSQRIVTAADEADGARPPGADLDHRWFRADMSGDGLIDLVRVDPGRVDYWPHLGRGRFGARITMTDAPTLDGAEHFDGTRVRLADLDGTGTADLVYVGDTTVTVWRNRSGTAWSAPETLGPMPRVSNIDQVQVVDLLGRGTPCLVWTTSAAAGPTIRYLDLAVDGRPNLMRRMVNNLGARTLVEYDTSARQAQAARRAGRPWVAGAGGAAVVVGALHVEDAVSTSSQRTSYTYYDSWFDPVERESRGFGYVETSDAQSFTTGSSPLDLPPVRTCEWFATGRPGETVPSHTFDADPQAVELDDHLRVGVGDADGYRQSARALAGHRVRAETFVDDGGSTAPVSVVRSRMLVRQLQPGRDGRPAVFRVEPLESTTSHYERTHDDPRVTHDATLAADEHGTPSSSVSIAYPRRVPAIDEQNQTLVAWTRIDLTSVDTPAVHRVSTPTARREYEITGVPVPPAGIYRVTDLAASLPGVAERDFAAAPTAGLAQRRLVSAYRYEFWDDGLTAALPTGDIGSRALVRRVLRFALSPLLVESVYGALVSSHQLEVDGGYELDDALWWATDGVRHYDPDACYLPSSHTTPFGNTADVRYDTHHLLVERVRASTTAPLSLNAIAVTNDYEAVQPVRHTDGNGVTNRVAVDPLGRVIKSWRTTDGTGELPAAVFSYGSEAWRTGAGPAWSHSATRERHDDPGSPWQEQRLYVDGLGRIALTKSKAEPGVALSDDGTGGVVQVDTTPAPRWIGSGRAVFDNKGFPVEQYEPYFAVDADFDDADALVKRALTQRRRYDAAGRLVRVDHPDGTVETVEIGPWHQLNSDRNDTVLASSWFAERQAGGAATAAQQRAATLAAAHADTPVRSQCDALGRVVRVVEDNGTDGTYETRFVRDLRGDIMAVYDPRGVLVGTQTKDPAGRPVRTESVDAGVQRALADAADRHLVHVTAAGHLVTSGYDLLGRPTTLAVREPGGTTARVAELTCYGEEHPDASSRHLVGQVHRRYDRAGLSRADRYDAGGSLVDGTRQLLSTAGEPDWAALVGRPLDDLDAVSGGQLDPETFPASGQFDALGRPIVEHLADGTTVVFTYGAGGLISTVDARPSGSTTSVPLLTDIDYDAKRRRVRFEHGNGVVSAHEFDELTGRPTHVSARLGATVLQDLGYTHDPVGNVVQVDDAGAQPVFFAGAMVAPGARFTYDPVYRLRTAVGREHASQGVQPDATEPPIRPLPHPNDAKALRQYTETYSYDSSGNMLALAHAAAQANWTRRYEYSPGTNRLAAHQRPGNADGGPYSAQFAYDAAGNATQTPNVTSIAWDHAGRPARADLGGGGTVVYHYDGSGNRVRKIWQRLGGLRDEHIYLGQVELFRRFRSGTLVFERRTVRVLDGERTRALIETITLDTDHPGFDAGHRIRYQLDDLLGSIAAECDEAGSIISYEEFHPFGTTSLWLARGALAGSSKRYRYLGKEKDEETGFYLLGARYYCPWLGRWLSPDPAGLIDGVNRYCYAGNNPTSRVDPLGLAGQPPLWEQMFFSESAALRFPVRSTLSGDGINDGHRAYATIIAEQWGAPPGYHLGHAPETPLWSQKAGTVSQIGIQSSASNLRQSVTERADAAAAAAKGEFKRVDRATTEWINGSPVTGRQPARPLIVDFRGNPVTSSGTGTAPGHGASATTAAAAAPAVPSVSPVPAASPVPPVSGPPGQLELPGVPTKQLTLAFDRPLVRPDAGTPPTPPALTGAPQQLEMFAPPKTAEVAKALEAPAATADVPKLAAATSTTGEALTAGHPVPLLDEAAASTVVQKDATAVAEVTKDAGKAAEVTMDAGTTAAHTAEAAAVAEVTKDAGAIGKAAPVAQDAEAVAKLAQTATPVAKAAAPLVSEAGALSKVVAGGAKVLKVVAPVAKVVGEVAKPLGVAVASVELVTASNNTDRLVAAGDLGAGVAAYCGPVGEAFAGGYVLGGLADKGVEKASKAAFGVDLSPSNGLAHAMGAEDRLVSAFIPDNPKQPAYKNENKVAWFLIDHLGF